MGLWSMQENLKSLVKYIVDSFWNQLVQFEYLASIQSLKVKYEQVFSIFSLYNILFYLPNGSILCLTSLFAVLR